MRDVEDGTGMEVIDEHRCRGLLGHGHLGRLGFTSRSLPVIFPVNYAVDGDRIIFRSESGSILSAAIAGDVACLQVDDHDTFDHTGWSVMATGRLGEIEDQAELDRLHHLALPAWRPMSRPHYLSLSVELLTGRRLNPVR